MNRRNLFLAAIVFQLVAVFGMFAPNWHLQRSGQEITLRTIPVDPRSVFRGDYVILGYEVGQDLPEEMEYGTIVYLLLEEKDGIWDRVSYSLKKPELTSSQVCLRGVVNFRRAEVPDISQYFVEEGLGRELENLQSSHRLLIDASVNDKCHAVITRARVGEETPMEWEDPREIPIFE